MLKKRYWGIGIAIGILICTYILLNHDTPNPLTDASQSQRGARPTNKPEAPSVSVTKRHSELPLNPNRNHYEKAAILSVSEPVPTTKGRYQRVKIIRDQRKVKYPLIQIEETLAKDNISSELTVVRTQAMVADHIIIKLNPKANGKDLAKLNQKFGAYQKKKLRKSGLYLIGFKAHHPQALRMLISKYKSQTHVIAYAEPDYILRTTETPDDTRFDDLYALHNTGQSSGTADADIDAPEAWSVSTGSKSVVVGVIDTGVDYTHEDLAANIFINAGEIPNNGVDDDANGYIDDVRGWNFVFDTNNPMDDHYHGTHVAGTIGAVGNNQTGITGVCWNVSIMPLKFLDAGGSGYTSDATEAIYYATLMGADMTSNSWGGGGFSQALADAIEDANQKGILFIAAAGNNGSNIDSGGFFPAGYGNSNIISVAATDHDDNLASFSNYGAVGVDLAAPGVNILSCSPGQQYQYLNGTSMAAPHVTGVCALLKSIVPSFSGNEIKNQVLNGVDSIPGLSGRCVTGGRLNANNALQFPNESILNIASGILDDSTAQAPGNNGDGIVNSGEKIALTLILNNVGALTANGVSATLTLQNGTDPNVTLIQDTSSFGSIPGIGSAASVTPYIFQVASSTITPYQINFSLSIQDDLANTWTKAYSVWVEGSYLIDGLVTLDGDPLADATVQIKGPRTGNVQTAADGSYAFWVTPGSYQVFATKSGFLPTLSQSMTLPPAQSGINFNFTTATFAGRITDGKSGSGISGANVAYSGDLSGSALTDPDGSYSIQLVLGQPATLEVTASKTGPYHNSLPASIALPPDQLNFNFQLQPAPDINVTPTALNVQGNLGDTISATLNINNSLTGNLVYDIESHVSSYETGDRGDILKVFFQGSSGITKHGKEVWINRANTSMLERISPVDGFIEERLDLPGVLDFPWGLCSDGTNLWVGDWGTKRIICINPDTRIVVKTFPSPEGLVPAAIDYVDGILYVYVYGTLYKLNPETGATIRKFPMPIELGINSFTYYNGALWCGTSSHHIIKLDPNDGSVIQRFKGPERMLDDKINGGVGLIRGMGIDGKGSLWATSQNGTYLVASGDLHWLTIKPESGEVDGIGTNAIAVTLDATKAGLGVHNVSIQVKSNDPDESSFRVPVTFTVSDPNNTAPIAGSQNLQLTTQASLPVTLTATDADGDTLNYRLISQPQHGFLIGSAPNLSYVPRSDFNGQDQFKFRANDGKEDSNLATITLNISGFPQLQIAPTSISANVNPGQVATQTVTITNTGTRALHVRVQNQTNEGGTGSNAYGNVLRELDISHVFPAYQQANVAIGPAGIAFDGKSLWITQISMWQRPEDTLVRLDPATGQVLQRIDMTGRCDPNQLHWDGQYLWITDITNRKVIAYDTRTDSIVRSFNFPAPELGDPDQNIPHGITSANGILYVVGYWTHGFYVSAHVYKLDANTGEELGRNDLPSPKYIGLTYLNGALWSVEANGGSAPPLLQLRPGDLSVIKSISAPNNWILGLAGDGEKGFWVTSRSTRKLYLVDSGESSWFRTQPKSIQVAPGTSTDIAVTLDGSVGNIFDKTTTLHIESNDPNARHTVIPVTITHPNQIPVAHTGPDRTIQEYSTGAGAKVYLNGYLSTDVDGTIVSYEWKKSSTSMATGVNPFLTLAKGTHTLTLTVTDNDGATATDDVKIIVGNKPTGTLKAWGENGVGEFGNGKTISSRDPVSVGLSGVTQVSGGDRHGMALMKTGEVFIWGNVIGMTTRRIPDPENVSGISKGLFIVAGKNNFVLKNDGTLWGWGANDKGQLGLGHSWNGNRASPYSGFDSPRSLNRFGSDNIAVAGGYDQTVVLKANGHVWVCGGRYTHFTSNSSYNGYSPIEVGHLDRVIAVAGGSFYALALKDDGTVWEIIPGYNGNPTDDSLGPPTAIPVKGLQDVVAISGGGGHYLALKGNGTLWGWGDNAWGQVGNGTRDKPLSPAPTGLVDVVDFDAGGFHSMAKLADGTLWAWGRNFEGSLGDGSTAVRSSPVQVKGYKSVKSLDAAIGDFSFAQGSFSKPANVPPTVIAGADQNLELPNGSTTLDGAQSFDQDGDIESYLWEKISGPPAIIQYASNTTTNVSGLSEGEYIFRLTVTDNDGASGFDELRIIVASIKVVPGVWGWGVNTYGQLGNGSNNNWSYTPVLASNSSEFTSVAAGHNHVLAIKSDGSVLAWGQGRALGNGSSFHFSSPAQVFGLSNVSAIAAGSYHSLAVRADGTLWTWGENSRGQLGDNSTTDRYSPVQVSALSNIIQVAGGAEFSLGLKEDGTVWAWGLNAAGQLGDGTNTARVSPVQVSGLTEVVEIAAGGYHSLARKSDGTIWAWGLNSTGQLGDGTTNDSLIPIQVSNLSGTTNIAAGGQHSLALAADRTVWAWGRNRGSLGDGTTIDRTTPVKVLNLSGVTKIAKTHLNFSMAIRGDGTVWTWGSNSRGLGDGVNTEQHIPVQVISLTGMTDIAGGLEFMVTLQKKFIAAPSPVIVSALTDTATVGIPYSYTIQATGDTPMAFTATGLPAGLMLTDNVITGTPTISGISNISLTATNAAGTDNQILALNVSDSIGKVWAWGQNQNGQLGNNSFTSSPTPGLVQVLTSAKEIAAGANHSLAIDTNGAIWAWGRNDVGSLGDGTTTERMLPTQLTSLTNATQIAAGNIFSLAVDANGKLWSWGYNNYGQLGNNTTTTQTVPTSVSTLTSGVAAISAGNTHALAATTDGILYGWGGNSDGQVGDGSVSNRLTPRVISGPVSTVGVSAGGIHSLALDATSQVWAWGGNFGGQLGLGNTGTNQTQPQQIPGLTGVSAIATGRTFSLALKSDGMVWAWGENQQGQLGIGTTISSSVPTQVQYLTQIVAIDAMDDHAMALQADGTIWAWGENNQGQLGIGGSLNQLLPIKVFAGSGLKASDRIAAGFFHSLALLTSTSDLRFSIAGKVTYKGAGLENVSITNGSSTATTDASGRYVLTGNSNGTPSVTATFQGYTMVPSNWSNPLTISGTSLSGIDFIATFGHSVSGTITIDGNATANVFVTDGTRSVLTNTQGLYSLTEIPDGSYTLTASKSNFEISPTGWSNPVLIDGANLVGRHFSGTESVSPPAITSSLAIASEVNQPFSYLITASGTTPITFSATGLPPGLSFSGALIAGTPTQAGTFSVSLTAENSVNSDTESLAIQIIDPTGLPNVAPKIISDPWANPNPVNLANETTLSVIAEDFDGPQALTYTWSKISGLGTVSIQPNGTTQSHTSAARFSAAGTYTMEVAISDGQGIARGQVVVFVESSSAGLGAVWTWGYNGFGQLGIGTTTNRNLPGLIQGLTEVKEIISGTGTTFALTADGKLWGWGDNRNFGSVGTGDLNDHLTPVLVNGLTNVRHVAAALHSLAVCEDGSVWAWGYNGNGQLGDHTLNPKRTPFRVGGLDNVRSVACSMTNSYALKADGTVWAWGSNLNGGLGDGTRLDRWHPGQVLGLTNIISLAAGEGYALALRSDGTVYAWGRNQEGQLGDRTNQDRYVPIRIPDLSNVVAIASGDAHCLAIRSDGSLWAWGYNRYGQLGDGSLATRSLPMKVSNIPAIKKISAGNGHSMAVTRNGDAWVWGFNPHGQLGLGTWTDQLTPTVVPSLRGVLSINLGLFHTVALAQKGVNKFLSGRVMDNNIPVQYVEVSDGIQSVTTDANGDYTLSPVHEGAYTLTATRWGYAFNPSGWNNPVLVVEKNVTNLDFEGNILPVCDAGLSQTISLPTSVASLSGTASDMDGQIAAYLWTQIRGPAATIQNPTQLQTDITVQAGGLHQFQLQVTDSDGALAKDTVSVTVSHNGIAWAWGLNGSGQLGNGEMGKKSSGSYFNERTPVEIAGLTENDRFSLISGGERHSLALKPDGTVWAWGRNETGQLGINSQENQGIPVHVTALTNVKTLDAGEQHSLACKDDGTVWAWGNNDFGQLGDNTTTTRITPIQVPGLSGVVHVAAGHQHSLALKSDGTVWAWGNNRFGRLGDGTELQRISPIHISTLTNIKSIEAGLHHSLALTASGNVFAWGNNWAGQLGTGNTLFQASPQRVPGLANITRINAGHNHNLAIQSDETVWAWGYDATGTLQGMAIHLPDLIVFESSPFTQTAAIVIPKVMPEDLKVTLKSSDTFRLVLPKSVTIQAGMREVWFPLTAKNNNLQEGIKKITISATSSMGTAYNHVFFYDDDSVYLQTINLNAPQKIEGLTSVRAVATGGGHSLALKNDGTVWSWGYSVYGATGQTDYSLNRYVPAQINNLQDIGAISVGSYHSLALKSTGNTYAITGTIMHRNDAIPGVTVTDGTRSAVTDASGNYSIVDVPNGAYNLTATLNGYLVEPTDWSNPISINGSSLLNMDFLANRVPSAQPVQVIAVENTQSIFNLQGSDPDGDPIQYDLVQAPANGLIFNGLKETPTPLVQYIPNPNFVGDDYFVYKVSDGFHDSPPAIVHITVSSGAKTFVIINLGTLGGDESEAFGINKNGKVVGASKGSGSDHAFLWDKGVMTDLGTLGGSVSYARDINDADQIVGDSRVATEYGHAFIWQNGTMTDLGTQGKLHSAATAINNSGQVVFDVFDYYGDHRAHRWQSGIISDLGSLEFASQGRGINSEGKIVGDSSTSTGILGFTWSLGTMSPLGGFGTAPVAVYDINSQGNMAGMAKFGSNIVPVIWRNGSPTALGNLGSGQGNAYAINASDQVVGKSQYNSGSVAYHAFLWKNGSMVDLNSVLAENSEWDLETAWDINDSTWIVGTGTINKQRRGFVMAPIEGNNQAPVVNAGPDQNASLTSNFSLPGTVSDDGLPALLGKLNIHWTVVSGPDTVQLTEPTQAITSVSFSSAGVYTLRLTAYDGAVATSDDITITVTADPVQQYTLTVIGGAGSGTYSVGSVIDIGANPSIPGQRFDRWTGEVFGIAEVTASQTTKTMPAVNQTITATYISDSNTPPAAIDLTSLIDEDASVALELTAWDAENDTLSFSIETGPGYGSLTGIAPNITYTPALNFNGSDSFTFKVNDGQVNSNLATVTINVNAVNDPPVTSAISFIGTDADPTRPGLQVYEGSTITYRGGVSDVDGDNINWSWLYNVDGGLDITEYDGTHPATPVQDTSFIYSVDDIGKTFIWKLRAHDGQLTTESTLVVEVVVIPGINHAPVAKSEDISVGHNVSIPITLSATDYDGDTLTYIVTSQPKNGTLSGTPPLLTYTPAQDFFGSDRIGFKANDGTVDSNAALIRFTVASSNIPPVAQDQNYVIDEDNVLFILLTATDADGDPLTYQTTNPRKGNLSDTEPNLIYTPSPNAFGIDTFTFTARDGEAYSNLATVTITVNPINDRPIADSQNLIIGREAPLSITLSGSDVEDDPFTYRLTSSPQNGTLTGTIPNLSYVPNSGFTGTDEFTFVTNDGQLDSTPATVSISVRSFVIFVKADAQGANSGQSWADAFVSLKDGLSAAPTGSEIWVAAGTYRPGTMRDQSFVFPISISLFGGFNGSEQQRDQRNWNTNTTILSGDIGQLGDPGDNSYHVIISGKNTLLDGLTIEDGRADGSGDSGNGAGIWDKNGSLTVRNCIFRNNTTTGAGGAIYNWYSTLTVAATRFESNFSMGGGAIRGIYTPTTITNTEFKGNKSLAAQGGAISSLGTSTLSCSHSLFFSNTTASDGGAISLRGKSATISHCQFAGNDASRLGGAISLDSRDNLEVAHCTFTLNSADYGPAISIGSYSSLTIKNSIFWQDNARNGVDAEFYPESNSTISIRHSCVDKGYAGIGVIQSDPLFADAANFDLHLKSTAGRWTTSGPVVDAQHSPAIDAGDPNEPFINEPAPNGERSNLGAYGNTSQASLTYGGGSLPLAADQNLETDEDQDIAILLTATDADNNPLTFQIVSSPTSGTLTGSAPNLVYSPNPNFFGSDTFTFLANDGFGDSNIATISILITAINDAPVAVDGAEVTLEDIPVALMLQANDADGETLAFTILSGPSNGTLSGVAPNLTYTPNTNYNGSDSFTFKANDGTDDSNAATVSITINAVNDSPLANFTADATTGDAPLTVNFDATTTSDVDGTITAYEWSFDNGNVASGISPTTVFTTAGTFTVLLTVTDDGGLTATKTLDITVTGNHTPGLVRLVAHDQNGVSVPNASIYVREQTTWYPVGTEVQLTVGSSYRFKGKTTDSIVGPERTVVITDTMTEIEVPYWTATLEGTDQFGITPVGATIQVRYATGTPFVHGTALTLPKGYTAQVYAKVPNVTGSRKNYTFTDGLLTVNPGYYTASVVVRDQFGVATPDATVKIRYIGSEFFPTGASVTAPEGYKAQAYAHVPNVLGPRVYYTFSDGLAEIDPPFWTITTAARDQNGIEVPGATVRIRSVGSEYYAAGVSVTAPKNYKASVYGKVPNVTGPRSYLTFTDGLTEIDPGFWTATIFCRDQFGNVVPDAQAFVQSVGTQFLLDGASVTVAKGDAINIKSRLKSLYANAYESTIFTNGLNEIQTKFRAVTFRALATDGVTLVPAAEIYINSSGLLRFPNGTSKGLPYDDSIRIKVYKDGNTIADISNIVIDANTSMIELPTSYVFSGTPNQSPVADTQNVAVSEDTALPITLSATDDDGDPLSYQIVSSPANGTLSGTLPNQIFTPNADFNGNDSFTFKANDGTSDSNLATISITVNAINDSPEAGAISHDATDVDPGKAGLQVYEGTTVTYSGAVSDIDGDNVSWTWLYSIDGGNEISLANGTHPATTVQDLPFTYNAGSAGTTYLWILRANDGQLISDSTLAVEVVSTTNEAPVAAAQNLNTTEDTALNITLSATDADGDPLTYATITGPTKGTLNGTAPNLTYVPNANVNGSDSFTFKANDGTDDSNIATMWITINPVNDLPIADGQVLTTNEDTAMALTLSGTDVDGDTLTFALVASPANGILSGTLPNQTYTPNANFNGTDSFTFRANDGTGNSNTATVSITINPVNDLPVADGMVLTTDEDSTLAFTLSGADVDGDPLSYIIVSSPSKGVLNGTLPNQTYTPNADLNGSDRFTFRINDGTGNSNLATVSITINAVNDAPVAAFTANATSGPAPLTINFNGTTSSDPDGTIAAYSWDFGDGGASTNASPSYIYTTAGNFTATLTVTDNGNATDTQTMLISVSGDSTPGLVRLVARDQFGTDVPDTQIYIRELGLWYPTGTDVQLIVGNKYRFKAKVSGVVGPESFITISDTQTEVLVACWTAPVTAHDQFGTERLDTTFTIRYHTGGTLQAGSIVTLPKGVSARFYPKISGVTGNSIYVVFKEGMDQVDLPMWTATLAARDQFGVDVPGATIYIRYVTGGPYFAPGTSITLPKGYKAQTKANVPNITGSYRYFYFTDGLTEVDPGFWTATLAARDQFGTDVTNATVAVRYLAGSPFAPGTQVTLPEGYKASLTGKVNGASGPYKYVYFQSALTKADPGFWTATLRCRDQFGAIVADGRAHLRNVGAQYFSDGDTITVPKGDVISTRSRRIGLYSTGYQNATFTDGLDEFHAKFRTVTFRALAADGVTPVPGAEIEIQYSGMPRFANESKQALPHDDVIRIYVYKDGTKIADIRDVIVNESTDTIELPTSW